MKKLITLIILFVVGCTSGPRLQNYQDMMREKVESPFFHVPPLNQQDFLERTWILLAESHSKIWYYDPYSLNEDEDGVITFDAFIAPRKKNNLPTFNPTIVGPYHQKIDCFSNNQWSETFYTKNLISGGYIAGNIRPVNGSGWVKISPNTAMAYIHSRICGRKFIDDANINYFLFQDGILSASISKKALEEVLDDRQNRQPLIARNELAIGSASSRPPIFYEVINNEVVIADSKKNIRQLKISSFLLNKDFSKQANFIFNANCSENSYDLVMQGSNQKLNGVIQGKESFASVAFNRACGNHGSYMKVTNRVVK